LDGLEVRAKITKLLIKKRLEEGHILAFSWVLVQNFLDLLDLYQLYVTHIWGVRGLDWHSLRSFISSWGSSHGGGLGGRGGVGGRGGIGGWFGRRESANGALGWSQGLDGTWLSLCTL
jgi:hypothetical protein